MPRHINKPMKLRVPKAPDPAKMTTKPPRMKPATTANYGRGGSPYSGSPDMGIRGAGIGYGAKVK